MTGFRPTIRARCSSAFVVRARPGQTLDTAVLTNTSLPVQIALSRSADGLEAAQCGETCA